MQREALFELSSLQQENTIIIPIFLIIKMEHGKIKRGKEKLGGFNAIFVSSLDTQLLPCLPFFFFFLVSLLKPRQQPEGLPALCCLRWVYFAWV